MQELEIQLQIHARFFRDFHLQLPDAYVNSVGFNGRWDAWTVAGLGKVAHTTINDWG